VEPKFDYLPLFLVLAIAYLVPISLKWIRLTKIPSVLMAGKRNPHPSRRTHLIEGDIITVIGDLHAMEKFREKFE